MGHALTFGELVFDADTGTLTRDGKQVALGTRATALLARMIEADGALVPKETLMEAAWPGTIVEEGNLSVQIAALRKTLGQRPDGSEWIATVPRVGYRLTRVSSSAPPEPNEMPALVVLPFQTLGADPEQDYFADGLVDDLITAFSRFKKLAVIARSSSFAYKRHATDVRKIAAELNVRYVLEGSVRRAGEKLRINAQLADGSSGAHIWAQLYDGPLDDVFTFQDRMVEEIVGIVEPQIQAAEIDRARRKRPESVTAYDLYLQAVHKFGSATEEDNVAAFGLVSRAVELEPNNGTYLASAADILQHRVGMGWPPIGKDDRERGRDLANRALAAAPEDPEVAASAGNILLQHFREYDRGLAIVRRAVGLNPLNFHVASLAGVAELHCGDLDVSVAHFKRAALLNPLTEAFFPLVGVAHVEIARGNYEEALVWAERAYALNSRYDCCLWMLAAANAHLDRMEAARRHCAELVKLAPHATVSSIRAGQPAKIPQRIEPILDGLRLAGLPEA
jgi:TolB-like protein